MASKATISSSSSSATDVKPLSRKRVAEEIAAQEWPKRPKLLETTDKTKWRVNDEDGRHRWTYLEDDAAAKAWPQSYAEKYYLGLDLVINSHPPSLWHRFLC